MSKRTRNARKGSEASDGANPTTSRRSPSGAAGESAGDFPRWLPALLIGGITLLLFRTFIFSGGMLHGSDTIALGLAARTFFAEALSGGTFPEWNPLLLGGTPFLEALSGGDALYPTSLLLAVMEPHRALGWKLVIHVFLGGVFMYGWVRAIGCSRAAALVTGIAYTVAPFFVTFVTPGHDGKLFVTALTPLLFWAMERTFTRRGATPYVAVALVVATVLFTTHFQFAYFLFGAAGIYYFVRALFLDRGDSGGEGTGDHANSRPSLNVVGAKRFALFLLASIAGAATAGVQLLPAVDYVTEYSRRTATTTNATEAENRAYASSYAMHPEEVIGLVVPEFPGNNSRGAAWAQDSYWGRNGFRDNHQYAGWVILLLAGLSFLGTPRAGFRRLIAGIGAVALLYALGQNTPVWGLFFEFLPGVSLFRATDNAAFLFGFAAITLAAFGVDRVLKAAEGAPLRARKRETMAKEEHHLLVVPLTVAAVLVFGALLTVSGGLSSIWTGIVYPSIPEAPRALFLNHQPFIARGFFFAAIFSAALGAVIWAGRAGLLRASGVVALLGVLVFLDGFRISHSFIQTVDLERYFGSNEVVEELRSRQAAESPFRVTDVRRRSQETSLSYHGVELATGHHPNDLARYRELIGMTGSDVAMNLLRSANVSRLLNVRYLVNDGPVEAVAPIAQNSRGRPGWLYPAALFFGEPLERARLVGSAIVAPDETAVSTILSPDFNPETTAVLAEPSPIPLAGDPVSGEVRWVEREPNRQVLSVRNDAAALLVVADNWFPAWEVEVNGEAQPLLRAYHSLRAVALPAGSHEVVFEYRSNPVRSATMLTLLSFAGLMGLLIADRTVFAARRAAPVTDESSGDGAE